ncbi:hypothetical protein C8Q72DRAFT_871051, partial [Fomitopsis betulina]
CDLTRPKTQGRLPLQAHWHGRQRELGMRSASESVAAPGQRLDDDGNHSDNTPLAVTTLTLFQTRRHILLECPRYANARCSTLRRMATVNDVLGTQEGIRALAKFVAKTEAFTKTGDARRRPTRQRLRDQMDPNQKADASQRRTRQSVHSRGMLGVWVWLHYASKTDDRP